MKSTSPIMQDPPVQHQSSTSLTRKGNPQSKNSKRQSNKKADMGARWDKWQKYMTEPEPQKGKLTGWGAQLPPNALSSNTAGHSLVISTFYNMEIPL